MRDCFAGVASQLARILMAIMVVVAVSSSLADAAASITEFCEDDQIDTQFCPLRPSIGPILNRLHNEAYLVCEDDILSPCTESVTMEDQQGSEHVQATTTTTTISPSTLKTTARTTTARTTSTTPTPSTTTTTSSTTTTSAQTRRTTTTTTTPIPIMANSDVDLHVTACPSCVSSCEEDRSRCDLSEARLTTLTTVDINRFVIKSGQTQEAEPPTPIPVHAMTSTTTTARTPSSGLEEPKLKHPKSESKTGEFSFGVYDKYRTHAHKHEGPWHLHETQAEVQTSAGRHAPFEEGHSVGFPKVLFDTFRKQPMFQNVQTFGEIRDQLHMLKYGDGGHARALGRMRIRRKRSVRSTERQMPMPMQRQRRDRGGYQPPLSTSNDNGYQYGQYQMNQMNQMNPVDEQKLVNIYGQEAVNKHRDDIVGMGSMRQQSEALHHDEHVEAPFHHPSISDEELQERVDQVRLNFLRGRQKHQFPPADTGAAVPPNAYSYPEGQHHLQETAAAEGARVPVTQAEIKRMLHELLARLDALDAEKAGLGLGQGHGHGHSGAALGSMPMTMQRPAQPQLPPPSDRCTLHGLWLSAITGIGIQLEPISEHEVRLHVIDLGKYTADWGQEPGVQGTQGSDGQQQQFEHYISSDWTGRAVVSTESATTISIILQEKWINHEKEPRTAVFVGQCVICSGSPTIQGTWIMFPESQSCFEDSAATPTGNKLPARSDIMYNLIK